jgi:hypothetical protein
VCPLQNCPVNESPVVCHRGQRDDEGTSCDKRVRGLAGNWGRLELPRSARTEGQLATSILSPNAAPLSSWILVHWWWSYEYKGLGISRSWCICAASSSFRLVTKLYATPHSASRWPKALLVNALLSSAFRYRFGQGLAGQSPTRDPYPMVVR